MVIESGRWSKFGKIVGAIKRLKEVIGSGRGSTKVVGGVKIWGNGRGSPKVVGGHRKW